MRTWIVLVVVLSLVPTAAWAFKPGIHKDISKEALQFISTTLSDGRTITFTQDAIEDVRRANWDTDIGPGFFVAKYHFTDELFWDSSSRLVKLKEQVILLVTAEEPDGDEARKQLGTAFHTLQDFYAHSNWVERGEIRINLDLGHRTLADPDPKIATCPGNPQVLQAGGGPILTTAYWKGLVGCTPLPPPGKCFHGGPGGCDGIHKDDPSRDFYFPARTFAALASEEYVLSILRDSRISDNDRAKKCLLGLGCGTLGMVIDDTGSMGPEISQVKAEVAQIVNSVVGTDKEPAQYLLVRFGDPDVGPPFETGNAAVFLGRVNALSASGGDDCPELAGTALLQAVSRANRGSSLFLFTDASAKDGTLLLAALAIASVKHVKIMPGLTGNCSPIDPAFIAAAEQTGGQLFFMSPAELANIDQLVEPQLGSDFVTVARAVRTLASGGPAQELAVPVDSTLSRAIFALSSLDSVSMAIVRPDGTTVAAGDPGVSVVDLTGGALVTVEAPQAGTWRVVLTGSGEANVAIQGNSLLRFPTFQFVELVNPIHEALAPIDGQPVLGATTTALAALQGPFSQAAFELVDLAGRPIRPLDLALGDPNAASDEYVGSSVLPSVPFRVAAVGLDESGKPFRRLYPQLFRTQPIEVRVDPASLVESLPIGSTTTLSFVVTNHGSFGSFDLGAVEEHGFVSRFTPSRLDLGTGESATVQVDLTVPGGTPADTVVVFALTAVSSSDSAIGNASVVELPVSRNLGPWQSADVGAVGIAGSATVSGSTVTIQAGGTALYDTSDAFHYVYQPLTGDGEIVARVASLTVPTGANSTLAGVMIREQLTADSIHASMIIVSQGKAKFRRRVTVGGTTLSDGPSTGTTYPPRWLKLSRAGDDFTASISDDGVTWTQVHTTQTVPMPETVYIGVMALRDGPGVPTGTATFENVSVRQLPSPWQNADVGPVGTAGGARHSGGIFTIEAGGTALYDTSDAFHYVYQPLHGDGEIVVNLTGLTVPAGAESSMAAVMVREKLTENSVHASMMITTAGKAKFRRRVTEGGTTLSDGPTIGTLYPPRWLRLTRSGDTFTAYLSSDGSAWTQIHTPVTVAMPANVHIGFMALRTGGTATTTATFQDVSVVP